MKKKDKEKRFSGLSLNGQGALQMPNAFIVAYNSIILFLIALKTHGNGHTILILRHDARTYVLQNDPGICYPISPDDSPRYRNVRQHILQYRM